MREIKFRAWDGGAWVEPHLFVIYNGNVYATPRDFEDGRKLKNCKLVEYTGLKDKNGTEIYEGDLIAQFKGDVLLESIRAIKWNNDRCGWWLFNGNEPHMALIAERKKLEVIGNIYENPELLNEPVSNTNKLD